MKITFILLLLFPLMSFSQEISRKFGIDTTQTVPTGIDVGIIAPPIYTITLEEDTLSSDKILIDKQIVLLFYRGEWCPVCSRYLSNLSDSLKYITEKNAIVIVVGPETSENAEKTAKRASSDLIIISDTSYKIQNDYDVLFHVTKGYQKKIKTFLMSDIAKNNGKEDAYLPIPATYIINQKGIITYKDFHYDFHNRASVKMILDNLTP